MGPDRLSSYQSSNDYMGSSYSFDPIRMAPGQLPNSKDVLLAMERGDLNEAMRLLNAKPQTPKNFFILLRFFPHIQFVNIQLLKGKLPVKLLKETIVKFFAAAMLALFKFSPKNLFKEQTRLLVKTVQDLAKITKSMAKMAQRVMSQLSVKIVDPAENVLKATVETFKQVMTPIVNWVVPKVEVFVERLHHQSEQVKKLIETIVDKVDEATAPFREKVKELSTNLVAVFATMRESFNERIRDKIDIKNLVEALSNVSEKTREKVARAKDKAVEKLSDVKETVTQVKETVVEVVQVIVQHLETIPAIVAPFAFWFAKQVTTPLGSIKENMRHFAKKAKKGLNWMGEKASSAGKLIQEGGEALLNRCYQGCHWLKDKILPLLKRIFQWLKRVILKISRGVMRAVNATFSFSIALTRRLASALKSIFRKAWAFTKHRIAVN